MSRIAGQAKNIENSDNLSGKPLWGTIFEKNIFNFQEFIVFEKLRKNENSGFYLINYANIRVKMTYFIASVPSQDSKLIKQKYVCLKELYLLFLPMVYFK